MEVYKEFLKKIGNISEFMKVEIEKMGLPYSIAIQIDKNKKIENEINNVITEILKIVPKKFGISIPYILGEMTDNIEQHSSYSNAFVFMKYNSEEGIIEICIFDDGLTIPSVFEKNSISFLKDCDAIRMALEGKTTKKEDIARGFGLRTTRAIVKELNGEMKIISREGMINLEGSAVSKKNFEKKLPGTLIYLKLKTPEKDLNIYSFLE